MAPEVAYIVKETIVKSPRLKTARSKYGAAERMNAGLLEKRPAMEELKKIASAGIFSRVFTSYFDNTKVFAIESVRH